MRAWMIILFLLLIGWAILIGPPQSWAPYDRMIWPYLGPLMVGIFALFMWPGHWVLSHIWSGFFDLTLPEFWSGRASWWAISIAVFAQTFDYVFSYFFWLILLSRFWKFIGRWNPFDTRTYWGRPYFLKMVTGISDWWEQEFHFGQHATGGFAS